MSLRPLLLFSILLVTITGLVAWPNNALYAGGGISWLQEEEDPFAEPQEEEEDPFAEPDTPQEPMEPEEEEDPFAEPDPDPTPKPVEPKPEPQPIEPKPQPIEPKPDPQPAPKPVEPPPTVSSSLEPTGSGTKEGSGTKDIGSATNNSEAGGSSTKPTGSTTKETPSSSGSSTKDPVPGSATKEPESAGSDLKTSPPIEAPDLTATGDIHYDKFKKIVQEIRLNEQRINQLVISMPVGFPEKRAQQQNQVINLRKRNVVIRQELLPSAQASFDNFPNTQTEITNYLMQHIQAQLTGRNYINAPFDPIAALEGCEKLIQSGVKNPILYSFRYRALYIQNNFPEAGRSAQKAIMLGQKINAEIFEDLKLINKKFEIEKELRQQDAANGNPHVRIELDCGTMLVELFEDHAPNTVANFVTLVQDGFYNGLEFYQANPTEIVLTGSPTNDGKGGPGYMIKSEAKLENARGHFGGTLSMLNLGENSSGSMFLVTKQPRLQFDGRIAPFGRIIEGLENLYKVKIVNRTAALSKDDPTKPTQIIRMTVVRKRNHEYVPEKIMPPRAGG